MRWIQYVAIALVNAFGVVIGIVWVPASQALAQSSLQSSIETSQLLDGKQTPQSLPELYKLRSRLQADLNNLSQSSDRALFPEPWREELQQQQTDYLTQQIRSLEIRILAEEKANETWKQAAKWASQAVEAGRVPRPSVASWERSQQLWQQAIDTLRQIPEGSAPMEKAIEKTIEYQGYLAIATYQLQIARSAEKIAREERERKQVAQPTPAISASVPPPVGFSFLADTNRDGRVNAQDEAGRETWSLSRGALVLFNNGEGHKQLLDLQKPEGSDLRDLAPVRLKLSEKFVGSQLFIKADSASRPYIKVFQRTPDGWQPVDLTGSQPLVFERDLLLGVEAQQFANRNWSGVVSLQAIAKKNSQEIASDTLQMGVSPWMMSPNTSPVQEVHVSDRGSETQDFLAKFKQIVEPTGVKVKVQPGRSVWMQDAEKFGYVQYPDGSGLRTYPVVLKQDSSPNPEAKTKEKQSLRVVKVAKPRTLDVLNQWIDGYGNLQVTPPLPGYPMGRIYYGNAGDVAFNPEVLDFIKAQKVQGPPVDIDTSWLLIRHVDEVINFIPSQSGKPLMLIVSPEAGVKLLQELEQQGYGDAPINRNLSTQTTIKAALSNKALIEHNLSLQREKLNPLLDKLKREFQLDDDQIIQVPAMFGYSGYAWWPNLVNSIALNGQLLVSNPRGVLIDGQDYTQEKFRRLLEPAGIAIDFLDDRYYQELKGNVHSATNTVRQGEQQPFWKSVTLKAQE